jgi:hypothetical protein
MSRIAVSVVSRVGDDGTFPTKTKIRHHIYFTVDKVAFTSDNAFDTVESAKQAAKVLRQKFLAETEFEVV